MGKNTYNDRAKRPPAFVRKANTCKAVQLLTVCDKVTLGGSCPAAETRYGLDILDIACIVSILTFPRQ